MGAYDTVQDAPIREIYGEQLSTSTTSTPFGVLPGFKRILIESDLVTQMALAPRIQSALVWDGSTQPVNLNDDGNLFDRRETAESTGTLLDSLGTSGRVFLGFDRPSRGVKIDVVSANGTASDLTAQYSKNDSTWAGLTETDGTDTGASLAQDGSVTWTVPTDWDKVALQTLTSDLDVPRTPLYWVEFAWSAALDSDTSIATLEPYAEAVADSDSGGGLYIKATTEYTFNLHQDVGALEFEGPAGTPAVNISWIK